MRILSWVEFGIRKHTSEGSYFVRKPCKVENFSATVSKLRKDCNNTDLYCSVFCYDRQEFSEAKIYGPLYFDFDCSLNSEDQLHQLKREINSVIYILMQEFRIPKEQCQLFFSGSKGFHLLISPIIFGWRYQEKSFIQDIKTFVTDIRNGIISKRGSSSLDLQVYDSRRVLRLTNSVNSKSGLYKIPLSHEQFKGITLDILLKEASKPCTIKVPKAVLIPAAQQRWLQISKKKELTPTHKASVPKKKDMLPCIKKLLLEGVEQGQRNNTAVALTNALLQLGYSVNEVAESLIDWNQLNRPPLSEDELATILHSAQSMFHHDKTYGCTGFKNLGLCTNECKFFGR